MEKFDAVDWVGKNIDLKKLTLDAIAKMRDSIIQKEKQEDKFVAHVYDIVSGSYGHYQGEKVAEFFGVPYTDEEDMVTGTVYQAQTAVEEQLNKYTQKLNGTLYFGNLEADGSYSLFYSIDEDEAKEDDNFSDLFEEEEIEYEYSLVARNVMKGDFECNQWDITLYYKGREMETPFFTGLAIDVPEKDDVISSLVLDCNVKDYDEFENWADDMGYDTDSRQAEKIFNDSKVLCDKFIAFVGSEEDFKKLEKKYEDY